MSSVVYPPALPKRVALLLGLVLIVWLAATLGADGLVQPIQHIVGLFEQLFGLHLVPEAT